MLEKVKWLSIKICLQKLFKEIKMGKLYKDIIKSMQCLSAASLMNIFRNNLLINYQMTKKLKEIDISKIKNGDLFLNNR
jgi:hypothetical protein